MKTKTKMPKAMYGKTMMKKGGVKKMQKGGMSTLDKLATRAKAAGIKAGEKIFGITPNYRTASQENILKNDANLAKNRANAEKVEANKRKVAANKDKVAINKIKTSAKKAGLSYQKGGIKKSLPKAQEGKEYNRNIKAKMDADKELEYISNPNQPGMSSNPINTMYGSASRTRIFEGAPKYLGVRSPYATDTDMAAYNKEIADFYKKNPNIKPYVGSLKTKPVTEIKKKGGSTKTMMKKGGTVKKKMMTGGMVNPNAKVSKQTVAGSKGVMSGVNPKASASNVASSKGSGRANTPPSQATPAAKRGGAVKMQKGGTTPRYSKSVYDSQGKLKTQKQMNKKMQKGGMIKRK